MQLIASNIANMQTTHTPEGGPYRRRLMVVEAVPQNEFGSQLEDFLNKPDEEVLGVRATRVQLDNSPLIQKYEPEHPHADAQGYVAYPNINPATEMVDMINTQRSYEANVSAVRSARQMWTNAVDMLRT
jgi:flagellar basal-body rod protein FlgC